jgi:hypothetical protein
MTMKTILTWGVAFALWTTSGAILAGAAGLGVKEVVEAGGNKEYTHAEEVVLQEGFWAKKGSDVTVRTVVQILQMSDEPHPRPTQPNSGQRPPPPSGEMPAELTGVIGNGSFGIDIGWRVDLPNPPQYYAITGIQIEEKRNRPCRLVLWGSMVDPRYSKTNRKIAETTLDNCKKLPGIATIDNTFVHLPDAAHQFVRSVQACSGRTAVWPPKPQEITVSTSWKIKGLKIRPGLVQEGSEGVNPIDKVVKNQIGQTNCKDHPSAGGPGDWTQPGWTDWHSCPVDQLATGVTLYHVDEKWFSGIALKCKYVRMLDGPPPKKDADGY